MNRKEFIQSGIVLSTGMLLNNACKQDDKKIPGKIVGASASIGHLIRGAINQQPELVEDKRIVIVGGGISGLSAARYIAMQGEKDFVVLDLEKEMGGNAACGGNQFSQYPWGAHYVPVPNNDLREYMQFLQECEVITGYDTNELPVYNEMYMCFDPQERLYINGRWQDGLIPQYGVPEDELKQINAFLKLTDELRYKKGSDGKDVFAIPVDASSKDAQYTQWDQVTMHQWLKDNQFISDYLYWYINYCTRDDFGTPAYKVSAWTALHYFASRKGKGANASHDDVLTWPQGNGWLAEQLQKSIRPQLSNNCLVTSIKHEQEKLIITYYDVKENKLKAYAAMQCILAVPQFVAARLLNDASRISTVHNSLFYTPWMVANITTAPLQERAGVPLSWDNVLYHSTSLGYVNASQQAISQHIPVYNFTFYLPLTEKDCIAERKRALATSHAAWVDLIINELKIAHPDIREKVTNIDIMIWGHAMVQPLPGLMHGPLRKELSTSVNRNIHFAHTDIAGISIFEEAFYQGLNAAKSVLAQTP